MTKYLAVAEKYIGLKEVPGKANNPTIVNWLVGLNAWWTDDLTPWCGTFIAHCLVESDINPPKAWYRAKSYLDWGVPIVNPEYGCIVVFTRTGGGHVGIVVGQDERGRLLVLGGNQGDAVTIAPFDRARVSGYRLPPNGIPTYAKLPVIKSNAKSSSNEA